MDALLIAFLIVIYFWDFLPTMFALDKLFHFMVFFVAGYMLNEWYSVIKDWSMRYWGLTYLVFFVANLMFVEALYKVPFIFRFILPFTGTLAVMTMAYQMEKSIEKNKIVQYIEYVGKYSLQFYLFTFCYPIIRSVIVTVMHIMNPVTIIVAVFVLQLITSTIVVEVTRRIKWLKIPCGY